MKRMSIPTLAMGVACLLPWPGRAAIHQTGPSAGTWNPDAAPDTVVEVRTGDHIAVETWRGSLTVRVGVDDEVRIAGWDRRDLPGLVRDGSELRLSGAGRDQSGDLVLAVPEWMPIRIHSQSLDVEVEGVIGGVTVEVLEGDLRLRRLAGPLEAATLDGEIEVTDVDGDVRLMAFDGDVQVRGVRGRVFVESADGDLELDDVEGPEVSATTVDGDVLFRGRVGPGGSLSLTTHDGDVRAWLPTDLGAQVEVSTFDGSFESDFVVRTRGFQAGKPLQFTVGSGSARVALQSFDGDIRLLTR
jgi:DUF4097 and DUF4098 domain-containing protein YvlB